MIATDIDETEGIDIPGEEEDAENPELVEHVEEATPSTTPADIDPVIAEELNRVIIEEEPAKSKAQIVPKNIIDEELKPEDWYDQGSI